jgi:ubiquinone biosynthesis protein
LSLSLKPQHLKRYKDIALLLFKYGRGDVVRRSGLAELLPDEHDATTQNAPAADQLADDVEKLGPTFIKLGQLLSTRPDIIPQAYADALTRLQDGCEPFAFSEVEQILEAELGVRLSKAFGSVDPKPLAAASIAQVHHATLRDGREVALKIQRPGIREQVLTDLEALGEIAQFLEAHTEAGERYGLVLLFDEFRKSLLRELDFRQEALHLKRIGANLAEIPEIVIPKPIDDFSTSRVLTMEFIAGTKITELSPLTMLEIDGEHLADALFRAYLKQMLRDGIFHADPHPGNVFLVDGKIALIDLGMVARITSALQSSLLQLLLAISENRADDAVKTLLRMGHAREDADRVAFQRGVTDIISEHQDVDLTQPKVGRAVLMLMKVSADNGIRLPPELAMIGKTLLNLDKIGQTLAPHFDPNAAIRRHASEITEEQLKKDISPGNLFNAAVELKNFVTHLPGRVNRILDQVADNEFRIKVDTIDEATIMEGLQKVANRIALGLLLAALIIGAALLMRVETEFRLFGYPGVAILLFLAAAACGIGLVIAILMNDIRSNKRRIKPRVGTP